MQKKLGAKVKAGSILVKAYSKNTFFGPGGTNGGSDESTSKPVRTGSIDDLDDGM